jgi:hypothetical protein
MKFNDITKMFILGLILVLGACSSGGSPNPNPDPDPDPDPDNVLAGSYVGTAQFEAGDIFYTSSIASFTISNTGALTGTVTAEKPSDVPAGEKGTVTGTITIDNVTGDAGFASIDMTVE